MLSEVNHFWVAFYLYLYCTEWSWITVVLHSLDMNTLAIIVNLWLCFSLLLCLPLLLHSSLSAVASQDWADRRRVGSINRNWTNYKADVPLYDGGRTQLGDGVSVVLLLSLSAQRLLSVVLLFIFVPVFSSTVSLTVWISSSCFHRNVFNRMSCGSLRHNMIRHSSNVWLLVCLLYQPT